MVLWLAPRLLFRPRCIAFGPGRAIRAAFAVATTIAVAIAARTLTTSFTFRAAAATGAPRTTIAAIASATAAVFTRLAIASGGRLAGFPGFGGGFSVSNQHALEPAQESTVRHRLLCHHRCRRRGR
jgi:hypothetical protein